MKREVFSFLAEEGKKVIAECAQVISQNNVIFYLKLIFFMKLVAKWYGILILSFVAFNLRQIILIGFFK